MKKNIFDRIILKLSRKNIIKLSDKSYITLIGKVLLGKKLDLDNPKTFNEKVNWLKIYDKNPEYAKMVDKYEVKKYISDKIGEEYIIPTVGVYEKFEDIDFESLPEKFVMKTTGDSGSIIICKDKKSFDKEKAKEKMEKSMQIKYYDLYREWPYKNVKSRIIIEKFMKDEERDELRDFKFYCFNGVPKFVSVSEGLSNHDTARISFADMNYKDAGFYKRNFKHFDKLPDKPVNFEKMKEIAKVLSKDIPFLRVDLYEINKKIYFGELTFYSGAGFMKFEPEKYDKILGDMLELPKEKRG